MAKYIECESFIAEHRHLYCDNCERRKGMKNGKMKFVYAIGDVPCRACDIGDMLDSIEDYPAVDVVEVVRCKDCVYSCKTALSLECEKHRYVWDDHQYYVDDDNFCCWGTRKDSDDNG